MADPMKKGDEMGKAAAKPVAYYTRPADFDLPAVPPVPVVNAPFFNCPGKGKTKRFGIVVGENTTADSSIQFTIKRVRAGVPTTMLTFSRGAWVANRTVELSTAVVDVEDGDVFTISITVAPSKLLPAVMVFVLVELGG